MKAAGQALGLLWLAGHLAAGASPAVAGDSLPAGEVERYVRYGFTLQNETGRLVPAADLAPGAWHLADPQSGVFDEKSGQYVATRVLGPSDSPLENFARFRYTGPGIKAVMNK